MVRFQPSFSFWPQPQFLGESRHGLAAWIIDNHRDGQTIEPAKPTDV
jgi:hypothetical protein